MQYLKGDKIFDGYEFLPPASVLVFSDRGEFVEAVAENVIDPGTVKEVEGIITPGFVNAHCHLELSHLHKCIVDGTGISEFALQVVRQRNSVPVGERKERMQDADRQMQRSGTVAVGDICNSDESVSVKKDSHIFYHSFIELIALDPSKAAGVLARGQDLLKNFEEHGLHASLAAHAPYSVSEELLDKIVDYDRSRSLPFSIHNQESLAEEMFLISGSGSLTGLFRNLGISLDFFSPYKDYGLGWISSHLPERGALLVHNSFTRENELTLLKNKTVNFVLCPSANLYIENQLPPGFFLTQTSHNVCLGTDSLASNSDLSILKECNYFAGLADNRARLKMLTSSGAKALGIENSFGSLIKGRNTGLNVISDEGGVLKFVSRIF